MSRGVAAPRDAAADPVASARVIADRVAGGARENFHVLSPLLPRRLRADFARVYAYCRAADDIADESGGPALAAAGLRWWREELHACFAGSPRHGVFVGLRETVVRHGLPAAPFEQLLDAFEQDQVVNRYDTWEQLLAYCRRSADPVGRIVLMIGGGRRDDAEALAMSDATCTALQLTNHWQDVRRDSRDRDRVYLPREVAGRHGLDVEALARAVRGGEASVDGPVRDTLRELVGRTWPLFGRGRRIPPGVPADLRPVLGLFTLGGEAVLRKVERGGYATHRRRPRVGRVEKLFILARGWFVGRGGGWSPRTDRGLGRGSA